MAQKKKNAAAVELNRLRNLKLTPEQRSESARNAVKERHRLARERKEKAAAAGN